MTSSIQLGEICEIRSGGTPSRGNREYYGGTIPWAKIRDLNSNVPIVVTEEFITEKGLKAIRGNLFPKGTLLFAIYGSMGKMGFAGTDLATNQAILGIQPKQKNAVNLRYLYHYLSAKSRDFQQDGRGVTQKNLSATYLRELSIPLPEYNEQSRIAVILDQANGICRKREQAFALSQHLLKAAFLNMFGNPVKNPKNWEWGTIGDCLKGITAGWSAKGGDRPATQNELGVLKISAVTSGEYIPDENKVVLSIPTNKNLIVPKEGDLLFSRANTRELVAATCIVTRAPKNVFLPDKLWRMDVNSELADTTYLNFVLAHPEYRQLLCSKATGTSGSMLNISKAKLVSNPIPIPPIEWQREFSAFWHSLNTIMRKQCQQVEESETLFACLLQRAFADEL